MGDRAIMHSHTLPILPPFNPDRSALPPLRSMFGDILSNDTSRQPTRRASVTESQPLPPFYRDPNASQSRARSRTDAAYTNLHPPQQGLKRLSPRTSPRMLPYARPSSAQGSPRILSNMPPPPPMNSQSRSRSPTRKYQPVYGASSTSHHAASSPRTMPMMIPPSSSSDSSASRRNEDQPFLVGRSLPTQSLYSYDPNPPMLSPRPISTTLQPAKFPHSSRIHERGSSGDDGDEDTMDVDRDGSDLISPISGYGEEDGEEDEEDGGASDGGDDPERKHICPRCSKRFNRPSSLKTHLHTHSGAKPFRCPHPSCGRLFNVNSNMRRHYRTHGPHPPRPRTAPIRRTTPNVPVPGSTAPHMSNAAGGAPSRIADDYAHPPYPSPGAHPLVRAERGGLSGPGAPPSIGFTAGARPGSVVTVPGLWSSVKKANSPGAVKAEREATLAALMTAAMG